MHLTGSLIGATLATLHLTAGPADLASLAPGLRLGGLDVTAALDQPTRLAAFGLLNALSVTATVQAPPLAALAAAGPRPFMVAITADGASLNIQGALADLSPPSLEATIAARIPDLRRTAAAAGLALPALTNVVMEARFSPAPQSRSGLIARGLRIRTDQGDLAGDLALTLAPKPALRGTLVSQRLDLDAATTPLPPTTPAPPTSSPAPAPNTPAAPASPASPERFPFARLREADADLRLTISQITLHGADYRAFEARLLLQDGRLRIDPVRMQAPGGSIQAQFLADATAIPPTASLTLQAPALDAANFATASGNPDALTGTIDLDVQLRAQGDTPRAMAATLEGHAGIALVDGDVENAALAALFGPALRAANLPLDAAGRSRVRCFALRTDAAAGQAAIRALALDATRLRLDGDGTINLVDETLDMHLRPTIRLGSTAVAIPIRLTGPFRAPKTAMERGAIAPGRVGLSIGASAPDPCPPALQAARDGRAGAMPR